MEKNKKDEEKGGHGGGKTIDVVSITKAIELIENDMQRTMGELAMLKKNMYQVVRMKKKDEKERWGK